MSDWKKRAEVNADVVCFTYASAAKLQKAEEVFVWDLDKTYLDTKYESLKGLWKTITDRPHQKVNVAGTSELVSAISESWKKRFPNINFPIYFITASPPQMEVNILNKLKFDGFEPIGIYCKDNLRNLNPTRWWRLTKQVGFKLHALLLMRVHLHSDVRQILWGDDSESDVIVYSIYSDICCRRLERSELEKILRGLHVSGEQVRAIFDLQDQIPFQDPVEKIYINLAEDTDAEYYLKFGRRTLATFNTFQTALDLFQDSRIEARNVIGLAHSLMHKYDYSREELERSFDDLVRRNSLSEPFVLKILPLLKEAQIFSENFNTSLSPKKITDQVDSRVYDLEGNFEPWVPERIDYLNSYR